MKNNTKTNQQSIGGEDQLA